MSVLRTTYFCMAILILYGCMVTSSSETYLDILAKNLESEELGKAKFLHGDMGGIYPHTLKLNAFVYKLAAIALAAADPYSSTQDSFKKYGFVYSTKIWNWQGSPASSPDKPTGLIFGKLTGTYPLCPPRQPVRTNQSLLKLLPR